MKTDHHIINIGRQYGSGGREIGEKLAEKLGYSYYDKELITIVSKESGLAKEFFEKVDEKSRFGIFGGLLGFRTGIGDDYATNYLNNENLFKIQSDVIRELSQKKDAVFVGRCADYILRDNPKCVNIFISANEEDRIIRVAERKQMDKDKIEDMLEKADKKRSGYYNYYTNKVWGAAKSYHLCINSSLLGIDGTVDFICDFIKKRYSV